MNGKKYINRKEKKETHRTTDTKHTHTSAYCEARCRSNNRTKSPQLNEVVNSNEMSMNKIKQKHGTHINRAQYCSLPKQVILFSIDLPSLSHSVPGQSTWLKLHRRDNEMCTLRPFLIRRPLWISFSFFFLSLLISVYRSFCNFFPFL